VAQGSPTMEQHYDEASSLSVSIPGPFGQEAVARE
jgi:hypothetical protein